MPARKAMKLKKIPYYLLLLLLAAGASLILGLLSFSGMFALWPILPLAFAAFGLSVVYEGEIYLQNIKGALSKLFKPNYLKRELAKDYLLTHFPEDTSDENCPQFFKDYERQLHLLHQFEHKSLHNKQGRLDKKSSARKKRVEKTLRDMEKWFAKTLFATHQNNITPYEKQLRDWLAENEQEEWQVKHDSRQGAFRIAQIGSAIAALCMGFGTTFLLVEAFTIIPFLAIVPLALLPALIIPMAAIAGTAYGLLTYNAITDMISDDTIRRWYQELSESLNQGVTVQNVSLTVAAIALFALTVALTICTAGTWWTVIKQTRPVFTWMSKIPVLIAQGFTALGIAMSTFVFNLGNTLETLDLIKNAGEFYGYNLALMSASTSMKGGTLFLSERDGKIAYSVMTPDGVIEQDQLTDIDAPIPFNLIELNRLRKTIFKCTSERGHTRFSSGIIQSIQESMRSLRARETIWQIVNPFRLLLKLTITPLRIILFLGHLISIGVTSDRVPGIPEILSALLGIISEGFEDAHYFVDHDDAHEHGHDTKSLMQERLSDAHGHSHDLDIPTRILKGLFYPLYCAAALWDSLASKQKTRGKAKGNPSLSYERALEKQMGLEPERKFKLPKDALSPSVDWQNQHIIHLIERQKEKLAGSGIAEEKCNELTGLQDDMLVLRDKIAIKERINIEKHKVIHNTHRITPGFLDYGQKTNTRLFLGQLIERTKSPTSVVDVFAPDDDLDLPPEDKSPAKAKDCPKPNCADCTPFSFAASLAKINRKKRDKPADTMTVDQPIATY